MEYQNIKKAIFKNRPNRFIAEVEMDGEKEVVHVKNTGRCKELLLPDTDVILEKSNNPNRKTGFDLIAVKKENRWINIDSQIPNKIVAEWIQKGYFFPEKVNLFPEKKYGKSRLDLYIESETRKAYMEIKGVTLEKDNISFFPDAPTERGLKHLEELIHCVQEGYEAYIFFAIQIDGVKEFRPNWETHKEFGDMLRKARQLGVHICAYDCIVTENSIEIHKEVSINLEKELVC